ncbi:MAG: ATP-grasp domain-containing protein [Bacteroidales bacterium]|nr:ATP-grasp domain-containing protein [Bacteroidales bacterium]
MITLDKPYVSDFLIKSIIDNKFPLISTQSARELVKNDGLNWISEEEARNRIRKNPEIEFYTNSENSITWIEKNAESEILLQRIQLFKNKLKFRELIADAYPDYFFKGIKYTNLRSLKPEELKYPFFIKPAVGFFSIAVHRVNNLTEWYEVLDKIETQIEETNDLYPKEVINTNDFILEEFIPGKEYAVDCYFDADGQATILNILHHVFSSEKDVSDRVYSTSKAIIEENIDNIQTFLEMVGKKARLKNFPMHVELRINGEGRINPIEVNPLRFGGFCTTADLTWHAYGINSYTYFFKSEKPDWKEIFKGREDKIYSLVVLDNNSGFKEKEIASFDYKLLAKDFEKPLEIREFDVNKYLTFGFVFLETSVGNEKELQNILKSNLRKYIKLK